MHPVTGFHVASVHSIAEFSATLPLGGSSKSQIRTWVLYMSITYCPVSLILLDYIEVLVAGLVYHFDSNRLLLPGGDIFILSKTAFVLWKTTHEPQ